MTFYTYILKCSDSTLYTGSTFNIDKRLSQHNSNCGAKYTKGRGPCILVYQKTFETRSEAMRHEKLIKSLPKINKLKLIEEYAKNNSSTHM